MATATSAPIPSRQEVFAIIERFLLQNYQVRGGVVADSTQFVMDCDMDSLGMAEFAMEPENELDIDVPDDVMMTIRTVWDALDYVDSLR